MKLEEFNLGEKLEKKQLSIIQGGDTSSNGQTTKSGGADADTATSDSDQYPAAVKEFDGGGH